MSNKRPFEQLDSSNSDVWQKHRSQKHNADYWINSTTGQSVWEDPTVSRYRSNAVASSSAMNGVGSRVTPVPTPSSSSAAAGASTTTATVTAGSEWTKRLSAKHGKEYWYNELTGVSSWVDPVSIGLPASTPLSTAATAKATVASQHLSQSQAQVQVQSQSTRDTVNNVNNNQVIKSPASLPNQPIVISREARETIAATLSREQKEWAVGYTDCPRVINSVDLAALVRRLRVEPVSIRTDSKEFKVIFVLPNDELADITRAVQEDQILKTRLKVTKSGQVVDLPSFWDVWEKNKQFSKVIKSAADPNEEKWKLRMEFGYKIATTFMPPYAKSIYEYFNAEHVLDPCAGWGDRLIGAAASSCVKRYVCFDPNRTLRPGYAKLMNLFGHDVVHLDNEHMKFSNSFQCNAQPFEVGALEYESDSFDLVFTSPPFFEYEMYNPSNPKYKDWIEEFYTPLFIQSCRLVKTGGIVAIHIGDTSAGAIEPFLHNQVQHICGLRMVHRIGLLGLMSGETRTVWIFKKFPPLSSNRIRLLSNPPVRIVNIGNNAMSFQVFDDGQCIGGTKQRLLCRLLQTTDAEEVIYAGPDGGIAQVALAYAAKLNNKKAVIFLNTYCQGNKPKLVLLAEALGATVHLPDPDKPGRNLEDTQADATAYSLAAPGRLLLPFGLRGKPGEPNFDLFREALVECLRGVPQPSRLWLVAGSGFLLDVLHSIWPVTKYMVVQVGKTVWPDQIENKNAQLFIAPEKFGARGESQPPYQTVPWYDAKLWQFAKVHWERGDCIWNVGMVPEEPKGAADRVIQMMEDSHMQENS